SSLLTNESLDEMQLLASLCDISCKGSTEIVNYFLEAVVSLPPGRKVLIPYRWRGLTEAHFTLIELFKRDMDNVEMTIFNSGLGINDFHASKEISSKQKHVPYWSNNPINIEKLVDSDFFDAFGSLLHSPNEH